MTSIEKNAIVRIRNYMSMVLKGLQIGCLKKIGEIVMIEGKLITL